MGGPRLRELTAAGPGAIRVLELTGEGALARVAPLLGSRVIVAGTFAPAALREADGSLLDEALVLVESRARVELHLHGSPALVERLRALLGAEERDGADLTLEEQAELRLAAATSEAAARILLDQAEGALRRELEQLLADRDEKLLAGARALAERSRQVRWLLRAPRIVLAGPVNAGKSTLFNLLVGRERTVVSPEAGTTRDVVGERVRLGPLAADLFDTAGERRPGPHEALSEAERAGQALAREWRAGADLTLWLSPAGAQCSPPPSGLVQVLHTLADLAPFHSGHPAISALHAPEEARAIVEKLVLAALDVPPGAPQPGAAVAFEPQQIEVLARAEASRLRPELHAWLATGAQASVAPRGGVE